MRVGIIGGSGLYQMPGVTDIEEVALQTPFGDPSDAILCGVLDGYPVAFLPRHGRGHVHNPSEVNYRANVWALKKLGCESVISVGAVGSMREELPPGHIVFIDQFIDRTRGQRAHTFFDGGCVAHVSFADPVCPNVRDAMAEAASELGIEHTIGGSYICIEGPQFSTRAESNMYRRWDASVIGMTNLTEAKLAREAELRYATMALVTDYDVWHEGHDDVTVEAVIATLQANVAKAQQIVRRAVPKVAALHGKTLPNDPARDALQYALITSRPRITVDAWERLSLLIEKYVQRPGEASE